MLAHGIVGYRKLSVLGSVKQDGKLADDFLTDFSVTDSVSQYF